METTSRTCAHDRQIWIYGLTLILVFSSSCVNGCYFPEFVQNSVNGSADVRDWRGKIKDQNKKSFLKYTFHDDILTVTSLDKRSSSGGFSRVCIQAFTDDRFLVAHEEAGQISGRYTCMQIKQRTDSILQLKEANLSENMGRDLCEEDLKLDGWLIIDVKTVMDHRVDCSIVGGFNMQIYDKSLNKGVCDGYLGETRLESECLPGDGVNFHYRQAKCVPDGLYMYPDQQTYCLANWEAESFNFILLKHPRQNYLWVLRYPTITDNMEGFTSLLMKDLYAGTENVVSKTKNYLSLSMKRQSTKSLDALCYDDYEICSVLSDPCSYSDDIARTCSRTCGFCTDSRPSVCQFNAPINGTWISSNVKSGESAPTVKINSTSLDIFGQETLHCLDWSEESKSTDVTQGDVQAQTGEQMLVTVSENGCRPRFSCAKFTKLPSNVLFLHLSQPKLWPLPKKKERTYYDCKKFIYTNNQDASTNPFRTRHENLFLSHQINTSVTCDLSEFEHFAVLFKDGVRCTGELTQNANRDNVKLSFPECSVHRLYQTFTCLEFSHFPPEEDKILVTLSDEEDLHCWLFPKRPENIFHLIESEQCNSLMKKKIRKGRLRPIATFSIDPKRKIKVKVVTENTITSQDMENIVQQGPVNDTLIIIEGVDKVQKNTDKNVGSASRKPKNLTPLRSRDPETVGLRGEDENRTKERNYTITSRPVTEDTPTPSVVVAAVVFALLVLQIPLVCGC